MAFEALNRIPNKRDWAPFLVTLAVALAGFILSAYNGYTTNDRTLSSRVSVVETHAADEKARLDRIEQKIDTLLLRAGPYFTST